MPNSYLQTDVAKHSYYTKLAPVYTYKTEGERRQSLPSYFHPSLPFRQTWIHNVFRMENKNNINTYKRMVVKLNETTFLLLCLNFIFIVDINTDAPIFSSFAHLHPAPTPRPSGHHHTVVCVSTRNIVVFFTAGNHDSSYRISHPTQICLYFYRDTFHIMSYIIVINLHKPSAFDKLEAPCKWGPIYPCTFGCC